MDASKPGRSDPPQAQRFERQQIAESENPTEVSQPELDGRSGTGDAVVVPTLGDSNTRRGYDPLSVTYDGDWQFDSIILFANQVCTWFREDSPRQQPTAKVLCTLIRQFVHAMEHYYRSGISAFDDARSAGIEQLLDGGATLSRDDQLAYERRRMIRIIGEEWNNLMNIVATARFLDEKTPVLKAINSLIVDAVKDLRRESIAEHIYGVEYQAIASRDINDIVQFAVIPHFGRDFELVSFKYAPGIFVVGVPVTNLYSPWSWTVIWHELASIYIQSERKLRERDVTQGVVAAIHKDLSALTQDTTKQHELITRYKDWMTENLLIDTAGQLTINNDILWDWAEELIEDAIGTICLGEAMADVLDSVLQAAHAKSQRPLADGSAAAHLNLSQVDHRHPPSALRVDTARSLARKMLDANDQRRESCADAIAEAIRPHAARMVARPWGQDEQEAYQTGLTTIGADQAILSAAPLRVRYALTAGAVYGRKLSGRAARKALFTRVPKRKRAGTTSAKPLDFTGVPAQDLLGQIFSERDLAKVEMEHSSHTDSITLNVAFSKTVHWKHHEDAFSWTHSHDA